MRKRPTQYSSRIFRPRRPVKRNIILAFLVGGLICTVAQALLTYLVRKGIPLTQAYSMTSSAMVFAGAFLTGLGVYDRISRVAGMGLRFQLQVLLTR